MKVRVWMGGALIGAFALGVGGATTALADPPDPTQPCELQPFDPNNPDAPLTWVGNCDPSMFTIGDEVAAMSGYDSTNPFVDISAQPGNGPKGKKAKAPKTPKTPKARSTGNTGVIDDTTTQDPGVVTLSGPF